MMKLAKNVVAAVTAFSMLGGYGVTAGAEEYSERSALTSSRSVQVNSRDWSKYTTSTAKARLSTAERTFYERLDEECLKYLTGTDNARYIDGVFSTGYISYGDLGLSDNEANEVEHWFKRNNPQYYFITTNTWYRHVSGDMRIEFQDFATDGEKRAEITNEMFDKLDCWIAECADEPTVWRKVIAINRKICESTKYDKRVTPDNDTYASGKNQSMYSVLMTDETVCSGYALTFSAMAHSLGIDSLRAYNKTHGWNAVKFDDGKYYYVDVTWNDLDNGYSEYMEKYIGFGTDSAEKFDSETSSNHESHDLLSTVEKWLPAISKGDYNTSDSDRSGKLYAPEIDAALSDDGSYVIFWWDAVSDAVSYDMDFSFIGNKQTIDTSRREVRYNVPDDSDTYYARIRAVDSHGNQSDWAMTSYNKNNPITAPRTPKNTKGVMNADGAGVTFTWDLVSGAENYQVQISYDSKFTNPIEKTVSSNKNSISSAIPDNIGTVYFRVRAVRDGKYSDWKSTTVKTGNGENIQFPRGDVDGNGKTNAADATMILKHVANLITLTPEEYARADIDGNGKVNTADATMVLKIVVHME